MGMKIKKIDNTQISDALSLMWTTFLQFEAPDYSEEGMQSFKDFIKNEEIVQTLEFWGAYEKDELQGVIASNENRKHICCFFVKAQYHRQGIGRKLWEYFLKNSQQAAITVNSSPYAVPVYHKLGFVDMDTEQLADGMRYTPMKFERQEVRFYDQVDDRLLKFAVIIAKTNGKWVFCKHKERDTYELPGGHREYGEDILTTAKRELKEETGAVEFHIEPVCVYSVTGKTRVNDKVDEETFGMLFTADIFSFEPIHSEIEKILITEHFVDDWTYPLIQPKLIREARRRGVL